MSNKKKFRHKNKRHSNNINRRNKNNYKERENYHSQREKFRINSATNWGENSTYQFQRSDSEPVKIIPINGLETVGTNCTLIQYKDDIIIIDLGLGLAEYNLPGVDAVVPNLSYLDDKKDKIRGIIITHGHTDHIGALQYLYAELGCPPIHAPRMASEMIKDKFEEAKLKDKLKINQIDENSSYYLGIFRIQHFRMTHTIMDNYGVAIDTPHGKIVTPSDYKFDLSPYKEPPSDYSRLVKLGDEGVLLLLDESTSVKKPGWAPSETTIAKDLEEIIRTAPGRLIIGLFSTMISRVRQITEIAFKYNKKIAILGKSIKTNLDIAHRLGYINVSSSTYISPKEINKYPDNQIIILSTGSQGEPDSALIKLAQNEYKNVYLKPTDTVLFSSSRIPGNELRIDALINELVLKGCKVITSEYMMVHASGHGCKEDHRLMITLTRPKFVMPIHGDPSMRQANKDLLLEMGYRSDEVILVNNGQIVELWSDRWQLGDSVDVSPLWIEGYKLGKFDSNIVEERKALINDGLLSITIKLRNNNGKYQTENIQVQTVGMFIEIHDSYIKQELKHEIINQISQINSNVSTEFFIKTIRHFVLQKIREKYNKSPYILITVI
ncbi:MAG: ribonuclease J [Candidatus Dojkabacteria bacterium]|nr:ribonuclease J [Candidatus Dojkabacteria bacterium]